MKSTYELASRIVNTEVHNARRSHIVEEVFEYFATLGDCDIDNVLKNELKALRDIKEIESDLSRIVEVCEYLEDENNH